jgi:hypothetical protein
MPKEEAIKVEGKVVETGNWNELLQRPNGRIRALTEGHSSMLY